MSSGADRQEKRSDLTLQRAVAEVPVDFLPKGSTSREIVDAKAAIRFAEEYHASRRIYDLVAVDPLRSSFLALWAWVGICICLSLFMRICKASETTRYIALHVAGVGTALALLAGQIGMVRAFFTRLARNKNSEALRLRWVCCCGTSIYDDYNKSHQDMVGQPQLPSDDLRDLSDASLLKWFLADLDGSFFGRAYQCVFAIPPEVRRCQNHILQTGCGSNASPANIEGFWAGVKFLFRGSNRNDESLPHHNPRPTPGGSPDNTAGRPSRPKQEAQYLLLCAPNSQHTTELIQIDTSTPPPSDKAFFASSKKPTPIEPAASPA